MQRLPIDESRHDRGGLGVADEVEDADDVRMRDVEQFSLWHL